MRYYNDVLCLEKVEYVCEAIATDDVYYNQSKRGQILIHGYGESAIIEYESLPKKYKLLVQAKYGDPYEYSAKQPLLNLVKEDIHARNFYSSYLLPDGRSLPITYQAKYSRSCDWLNMIMRVTEDRKTLKDTLKISMEQFWASVGQMISADTNNALPASRRRLDPQIKRYRAEGYKSLIEEWRFVQENARIVSPKIESLLMALYTQRHCRATLADVVRDYNDFMRGKSVPVDLETGEIFTPEEFLVKGQLYELAPSTVKFYLNKKHNREVIDAIKLGGHDFVQKQKPHNRRKAPRFAFSKISMDDYLPPFKTMDGKRTVWMYIIFDVASGAIVGVSYGLNKNHALVDEALKDMLRLCLRKGWGLPMEIEMERSLNWERRGNDEMPDIFTTGHIFPFVHFTKGNNSQEKRAEHFLKSFKYEELASEEGFLGRPHARNENYKLNRDKKEARYMVKALIDKLKSYVDAFNNSAHPTAEGVTRWEFLEQSQNPDTVKNKPHLLIPYVGHRTETSVRRGVARVQNEYYEVPVNIDWMSAAGGVTNVDAYWIPGEKGESPNSVYLYQNGEFVCEAKMQEAYQEAWAERTDKDWELLGKQSAIQRAFENKVEQGIAKVQKVGSIAQDKVEINESTGVVYVGVGYDKLEQEEEEYADINSRITPENVEKTPGKVLKDGGYMQEIDLEEIIKRAKSSI